MSTYALAACAALLATPSLAAETEAVSAVTPLAIGETFTIDSSVLRERRRINVYRPPVEPDARLPVLYMPDGGLHEDFFHVAGLVQISVANATMRPFLLVGIENTERRRDLTGPTHNAKDREIAARVGGSAAFREFIRDELMQQIKARYQTTDEAAIVGESLAGLFDAYIAVDPSLWWNDEELVGNAQQRLSSRFEPAKALYLATSDEQGIAEVTARLAAHIERKAPTGLRWHYAPMPEEQHLTIVHPAALRVFRTLFRPSE